MIDVGHSGRCFRRGSGSGHVRYTLRTACRDGTTHVIFEPMDFTARLAALVPKPRAHLTRYFGVFAPASALRARVALAAPAIARVQRRSMGMKRFAEALLGCCDTLQRGPRL